ncbi:UDP-N-acetylglucosamine 1-carboxyvinyltransferase [Victivallis sp. Marseille-Q1083]|uniref:UDP-N-acetylglucosamine 1-carboxyvinyltransferase n=1 Tax=Victivallis sp. Marseille-Q1083 TaxID=2717288 RepID=UPI00158B3A63|nr:UDP-N-acetylglucosamine 1-carboxyvinyltransferase [Victivallis sp. Marseille-Q1083]
MQSLKIEGGAPIGGEVVISGNKNAALPMIAAALLTEEEVVLHNMPDILDVRAMLSVAELLGADVSFERNTARIRSGRLRGNEVPRSWCSKMRTSILFAAPLTVRTGGATLYPPGGDIIGRRRLDGHFYGVESLGGTIECDDAYCFQAAKRLRGRELFLDEASVTATEQILMAAVLADGVTVLRNAASEPHVTDLAELLNTMGAKISGLGSNTLTIEGVESLHGVEYTVGGDHIEAGSFLAMGAACGGELTIRGTTPRHYWMMRRVFERLGIQLKLLPDAIFLPGGQEPGIKQDFGGHIPVIADGPWPQFPSDMMSCAIVAATQSRGTVMFFEKMFESRIYFVDRLISMGANAIVCDPHRAVITGPVNLRGTVLSSPDIRAGMALLIAAMCASGQSVINSSEIIFRGYENIVEKIQRVGGKVTSAPGGY